MFKIIGGDQKEYGPISVEQIRQWIRDGRLNAQTPAQRGGEGEWLPLSAFEEFADIFQPGIAPGTPATSIPAPGYAPSAAPGAVPIGSRDAALSAVKGPAIALIITSGLGIAYYLFSAAMVFLGQGGMHRPLPANIPPEWQSFIEGSRGPLAGVLQLFFAATAGFILFGGLKMMKLQGHTLAIITCIIAMLPCGCCCIFGLPFGIWGLVVLNKPDVKSQFSN
jgi:hypothetical protein